MFFLLILGFCYTRNTVPEKKTFSIESRKNLENIRQERNYIRECLPMLFFSSKAQTVFIEISPSLSFSLIYESNSSGNLVKEKT